MSVTDQEKVLFFHSRKAASRMHIMRLSHLFLAATCSFLSVSAFAMATEIHVYVEDTDSPPYNLRGEKGLGFILMGMVQKKVPAAKFRYAYAPWERALASVGSQADALLFASFKENRTETGVYPMKDGKPDASKQLALISYSLFVQTKDAASVKVDGTNLTGIDKAKDTIGTNKGYSIGDDLKKAGYNVAAVMKSKQNISKLALGRLKAVAALSDDGRALIAEPDLKGKITEIEPPLVSKPYYLIFSKKFDAANHELVTQIWNTIAEVRESKEYKKAAQAYLKSL
jgi:polar amino acid transport system substrate-binding protein